MVGAGRLADPETIASAALAILEVIRDFAGQTVLITAGPTREPVDPVRFLGNRSSGKMGYALAEAALRRGAKVIVVSGPVALEPPAGVELVSVETAEEMRNAVLARAPGASIIIAAAAVSDFRLRSVAQQKIKRNGPMTLDLEATPDILAELATRRRAEQLLVGFAAETQNAAENGRLKLRKKGLDAIVVNDVSKPGIGFDSDRNEVTILTPDSEVSLPETSKSKIAHRILDVVLKLKTHPGRAIPAR
jgi:phosphopantothenoylcysteine decarboxylase/phosphopantothenate--cysteine ligase